jgi:uncharacterized protein (DUF2141 family)
MKGIGKMMKVLMFILFLQMPAFARAAIVIVYVNKVKLAQGNIRASLCENEAAYKADKCIADSVVKAQKGTTKLIFENVVPGTYGIQLIHDKNSNGEMDFNFLGIPKEGYGFSNNAKPTLSAPSFKKIGFAVDTTDISQSINLIH